MLNKLNKKLYNMQGVRSPDEVKQRLIYWNTILRNTLREFKTLRVPQRTDIQMITLIIEELEWILLIKNLDTNYDKSIKKFLKEIGKTYK